ncbi:hypothetical protein [Paracoccus sp. MKU1]|uniref:hypothetical protein n=1 Tax=Paracoccus sp. MKU1 TaxID=1745182 RepID=UPI00071921C3|nr:hypothetical protein [Paracoccus sp. MKU1]KRW96704.1 hypothetical protein AQY21_07845 [Paracoccus sp. MKU1]
MSLDSATEYALSFSEDAVHLERRERDLGRQGGPAPAGWRHLGSVEFDSPGFHEELARLRAMATGAGAEVTLPVTLIIPDDQILYTTLTVAPGADREHAVGRALDGLTPYAIEDLAFDWEGDGDSVRVAAVARQTLREARDFARQYGFEGQGYCSAPAAGLYPGEPVFVLEPAPRSRPQVDPAQAGVTVSALLIEEEPPAEQHALDLEGDRSDLPEDEGAESLSLPQGPGDEAEPVSDEPVSLTISEETDGPDAAATAKADGVEDIDDSEKTIRNSEESLADDPAESAAEAVDPVPVAQQDDAAEAVAKTAGTPAAGEAEAAMQDQVPDSAEAAATAADAMPAAQHDAVPQAAAALNPRARAVHERAASARQTRPAGSAPAQPRRPGERGGLAGLIAMLGALVVGLILIWAFLVPEREGAQLAAVASSDQAPTPQPAEPAPAQAPAPEPAPAAPAPAATASTPVEPVQPEPAPAPAAPQQAAPQPAVAPTVPPSALTEEERRRVVVAAAAVAAAVVPPSTAAPSAPASPAPALAGATSSASQAVRPDPAAPPRPAPTQARPAATPAQPAPAATRLTSSARPQLAPRRSTPQTTVPRADSAPRLPADPLPFEASQRRAQPVSSARPPERHRRIAPTPTPAAAPAPTQAQPAAAIGNAVLRGSARPPSRPEGSTPELPGVGLPADSLTPAEQQHLRDLVRDLGRDGLAALDPLPRGERLAQARPQRKPDTASDAVSPSAVDAALRSATTPPPDKPDRAETAAAPARDSGGLLHGSVRPRARPGASAGAAAAVSGDAVEAAISAAVAASPAPPGGVQLSALASSPLPPRRGERPPAAPEAAADPPPPESAAAAAPAAAAGPSEAELAARRKLDEQLQAQAEARIRARAAADAKAEAEARAQAEARARAQAEAEERAARAQRQEYKPPEIDNEPEIATAALPKGSTSASVAKAATQSRGIDMGRTTVIGIIGAGKASRALIRLRNGKVVTVRLGDRIDGGTINSIGDGRLTYVKAGRTHELRMLDGR